MKLKFDASQKYQLDAIVAITGVFAGQPIKGGDFSMEAGKEDDKFSYIKDILIGNKLVLDEKAILQNVQTIQKKFNDNYGKINAETREIFGGIPISEKLGSMNFSLEMETGTGKTYVYLRSIHELYKTYGFKKFIIVVPSIAIKEGVLKNLQITKEHFAFLYNNPRVDFYVYDPKKRGQLKNFAKANTLQILVINIDSFARKGVIINQKSDWGVPIHFIQAVNPIVIVDEPQNMETEIRKKAIADLNPLCTFRFSATHKELYNLLYKLDPVRAYDLGLVKKIEVDSVYSEDSFNEAYVKILEIKSKKNKITVRIEIDKSDDYGLQRKEVLLNIGDDLYELSGHREVYKEGFVLNEINVAEQYVIFSNGKIYYAGQANDSLQEAIMKYQIKKTVQNHFEKEKKLKEQGIKVLSLFFVDKVANYRKYMEGGLDKGKFAKWFEEIYREFQNDSRFKGVLDFAPEDVHNGYFAQDKKTGFWKDSLDRGGAGGLSKDDEGAYELIMKDKEKLLDVNTPLRFIFSHSALREGWDNPNVFQICTLNETKSEMKKRQEIGRGLRLPVNQEGERVFDGSINILTVIPNESYETFAKTLQTEIENDCGVSFSGRIKNKRERRGLNLKKGYDLDPNFKELWDKIKQKTKYNIEYKIDDLVENAGKELLAVQILKPKISSVKVRLEMKEQGVEALILGSGGESLKSDDYNLGMIIDILTGVSKKIGIPKDIIYRVLEKADKIKDILVNPQQVMDEVTLVIKSTLGKLLVDGIKYEKIAGDYYEMKRFENEELESYLDKMVEVKKQEKTLYDFIPVDSDIENKFSKDLESREDVKFYFKLPSWFKIETPLGGYTPDWAVVFENDKRIYFVIENKSAGEIRESEELKIDCGKKHFEELGGVEFRRAEKAEEIKI